MNVIIPTILFFGFIGWAIWYADKPVSENEIPPLDFSAEVLFRESEKNGIDSLDGKQDGKQVTENVSEDTDTYPRVSVEIVDGRMERTIHMGVRQWAWDPEEIRVKQGELVRLVIHNADVPHAIAIPELGIDADIPEEGAVVEFVAKTKGTFRMFCSVYCGEGHMEMQGKILIE